MSFLRKMYAQVRLDSDAVAAGATVRIMRPGCRVTGGGVGFAYTDNPGAIYNNCRLYIIDSSGDKVAGTEIATDTSSAVTWDAGQGAFKISWASNSPAQTYEPSNGERLVFDPDNGSSGSFAKFYQTDTAGDTPVVTSFALPASGKIEGYVNVRDVDIFVTYNSNDTYITDVSVEPRDFVTPEDFGADFTSAASNWQNVQNALDYLSYVALGGELLIPANTYTITNATSLTINGDGVKVRGQGASSILKFDGSGQTMLTIADGVDDVAIESLVLDHSTSTSPPSPSLTAGLLTIGSSTGSSACKRIRVFDVQTKSRYETGMLVYGAQGLTILNCILGNGGGIMGGHGISINDGSGGATSKRVIISSCQLYDSGGLSGNGAAGLFINVADRVMIDGCSIRGWDYGVKFADGGASQDITIDSCHIREQNNIGIYTASGNLIERLVISGNTIDTTGDQGIYLDSSSSIISAVINGNSIMSTGKSGMVFDSLLYSTVANNVIRDWNTADDVTASAAARFANQAGIGIDAVCTGTSFVGNKCFGTSAGTSYGFYYATGTVAIESIGNSIVGSVTGDHYFETPANASSNSWFNQDFTTKNWYWGDPDGTVGILKTDGSIDMGGGDLDTEGGGINTGGGDIDMEGGSLLNAVIAPTTRSYCFAYLTGSTATATMTTSGTYYKTLGTFAAGNKTDDFTVDTTAGAGLKVTYTDSTTKKFAVTIAFSFTSSLSTDNFAFRAAVDGTTDSSTQIQRYVGTGTDVGAVCITFIAEATQNQYLELFVTNLDTNGGTVTLTNCAVNITEA